jgi:membrane dipeptidase
MDARSLHAEALVVDAHADILCDVRVRRRAGETQVLRRRHLPGLRAGGITAVVFAIYLTPYMLESALRESLLMIDDLYEEIAESGNDLYLVRTAADLIDRRQSESLAVLLSLEGAEPIGMDLGILRLLHQLGLRALGLTWARRNAVADGNREEHTGSGLTQFGREVVRECGRLGILVDVSHLSTAGFWDVLRLVDGPVIASHSNARALCDHPRNLTDDQLRALASLGGVVGINACPDFVDRTLPSLDRLLDHADHIASVMGTDHVGLGLDLLDYLPGYENTRLAGLADASETSTITIRLAERGVSEYEIRDLLGRNWLRVWQRVIS